MHRVPVIDVRHPCARALVTRERQNGNPVILENHEGWTDFAKQWVLPGTGELDADRFVRDVGAETLVPIVRPGYDEHEPVKEHMAVKQFIDSYWRHNDSGAYLHQWQFAITDNAEVRSRLLDGGSQHLPCLGHNMLRHWLDICRGDNPLQYLFMGPANTYSKLHRDNGGCAILIAPITGVKEMTLVHRDDTVHLYDLAVDLSDPNLHRFPSLSFARVWRHAIKPGQILLMPAGTYHAARNLSPCLAFSSFHLDAVNAPLFYRSFLAEDAPELSHAEILWNCTHDIMERLEPAVRSKGVETPDMTAQLEGLRMLRHLVRAIQLDAHTPSANGWEWGRLLQGVDESLHAFATRHTQTDKDGPARDERIARSAPAPAACAPHGLADEKWQIEQRAAWQKVQLQKGDVVVVNYNKKNLMANVLQVRAPVTRECLPADRLSIAPLTPFHSFRLSLAGAVRALLPRHRPVLGVQAAEDGQDPLHGME
jgi:hypothetical protein